MCFDVSGRNIRVIFLRKFTLFFRRIIIYLLVWMTHMPYIKGEKEKTNYLSGYFFFQKSPYFIWMTLYILLSLFLQRYSNKTHEWMVWWILIYLHSFGQGPSIIKVLFDWTSDGKGFLKNLTKTWNPIVSNPLSI